MEAFYVIAISGFIPSEGYNVFHADFWIAEDASEAIDAARLDFIKKYPTVIGIATSHYRLVNGATVNDVKGNCYTLSFSRA